MKNKKYYIFGTISGRFEEHKISKAITEKRLEELKSIAKIKDDEKYDEAIAKCSSLEQSLVDSIRIDKLRKVKCGWKLLGEEMSVFISTDLTKAKLAFVDWYIDAECF